MVPIGSIPVDFPEGLCIRPDKNYFAEKTTENKQNSISG